MNLTEAYPRSAREKVCGVVMLARTIDKAKAVVRGEIGAYHYNCPLDAAVLSFLDIEPDQLLAKVRMSDADSEIDAFVRPFVAAKQPEEIAAFNAQFLTMTPAAGDSRDAFTRTRAAVAPDRNDVTTWVDLLDLEEGRDVPPREAVVSH